MALHRGGIGLLVILTLVATVPVHVSGQSVSVQFNTDSARYVTLGDYSGIVLNVTNSYIETLNIVVYATFRSGLDVYIAFGTAALAPNQTLDVFAIDLFTITPGVYTVTFAAITTTNDAVSVPTTPISIVVPP